MRTVRDEDGRRLLLVKRSGEASLVRDPETGEHRYVRNDRLTDAGRESPLSAAAGGVPAPVRRAVSAVHDDRSLGLLVELVDRGPVGVRTLLAEYDLCESDLHGLLAEFVAAGLLAETTVAGERGYEPTDDARAAVAVLRDRPEENRSRSGEDRARPGEDRNGPAEDRTRSDEDRNGPAGDRNRSGGDRDAPVGDGTAGG